MDRAKTILAHLALLLGLILRAGAAWGQTVLPSGFSESVVISGLTYPTAVRFAPDGRVFVAEQGGVVKVFSSLSNPIPTVLADLSVNVDNYWDRGLLGLAIDPAFPSRPYVYVLYTLDAPPGGTVPTWNDGCPTPPGPTNDGCVVTGRLSRIQVGPNNQMVGSETVLIDARWCQQFPSHSVGDLQFGPDGALYVSAGDGANLYSVDYGQFGGRLSGTPTPVNPCGDPPGGVGGSMVLPDARGGSLRVQRLISPYPTDPPALNGSILRVDPNSGAALPTNPLYGTGRGEMERIVAMGLRNPFRFTLRPGTREIWIGDVGWSAWDEIDRVVDPLNVTIADFGWPCYEGPAPQPAWQGAGATLCNNLYTGANLPPNVSYVGPYYAYDHTNPIVPGDPCPTGSTSISGLAFYPGGNYPAAYAGTLFFADYSRQCIWAMHVGVNGLPDPAQITTFAVNSPHPVGLTAGPGGDLFYVNINGANATGGEIRRIQYTASNHPPIAVITADTTIGPAPLTVHLSAASSSDPDGDGLTFAWDLYGSGQFKDATSITATASFSAGAHIVRLRITDSAGLTDTAQITIDAGYTPPLVTILAPTPSLTWAVGDVIAFSGQALDAVDGALPASAMQWHLLLHHCPSTCHLHAIQDFTGVSSGSFAAPNHEYPSYLELQLTATNSGGLSATTSVDLNPATTTLIVSSVPSGLTLALGPDTATTPFAQTVIVGSVNSLGAPSPQSDRSLAAWSFQIWSDGGTASHEVTAPSTGAIFTANFVPCIGTEVQIASVDNAATLAGTPFLVNGTGFASTALIFLDGIPIRTTARGESQVVGVAPSVSTSHVFQLAVENPDGCRSAAGPTLLVSAPTCGLLGIEPLFVLTAAGLWNWRRSSTFTRAPRR